MAEWLRAVSLHFAELLGATSLPESLSCASPFVAPEQWRKGYLEVARTIESCVSSHGSIVFSQWFEIGDPFPEEVLYSFRGGAISGLFAYLRHLRVEEVIKRPREAVLRWARDGIERRVFDIVYDVRNSRLIGRPSSIYVIAHFGWDPLPEWVLNARPDQAQELFRTLESTIDDVQGTTVVDLCKYEEPRAFCAQFDDVLSSQFDQSVLDSLVATFGLSWKQWSESYSWWAPCTM